MISADGKNVILVLGAPRSGTTWLAKVFDSHPDVIYRHEPDTILRSDRIPVICTSASPPTTPQEVHDYLARLLMVRNLKTTGSLPLFRKRFRRTSMEWLRTLTILGAKFAARGIGSAKFSDITIPDFVNLRQADTISYVLKSVSARGRIRAFSENLPCSRIVFLIRHPCGQVASTLNGIAGRQFERTVPFAEVLLTDESRELGLTRIMFEKLDLLEQCAWHWAILNQKAANDLPGPDRATTVRYEDLCAAPESGIRELFQFTGLNWNRQSARFVEKSTTADDGKGYYRITRNSLSAAQKWRTTLDKGSQQKIVDIAKQVPVGRMFDA
jgi:hypothetical protein